jgi:cytochrome c oxidase subunit 4
VENENNHIIPYKTFLLILAGLITLTLISVILTQISLGTLTVAIALLIAGVKSFYVLRYFMHLKFETRLFTFATIGAILLLVSILLITLLDYIYR